MAPFDTMSEKDRDEWIDYIANCGLGEVHCKSQTDASDEAIADLMLDAGYDRCARCDWWEEVSACAQIDGECVCDECREEGEEDDV